MTIERLFTYSYTDGREEVLLPADEGAWSLEGTAHAVTLVTHFALEGRIKRRAPYSDKFKLLIGPPRTGSWATDFLIQLAGSEAWAGAVTGAAVSSVPALFKLFKRITERATGSDSDEDIAPLEAALPGTFEALVEAVEPSLLRAHRVIHDERTHISISAGIFKVEFNHETKKYLETTNTDERPVRIKGNVASYNVNNRAGRIFIDELGRTVPFLLSRDANQATEIALAQSLQNYAGHRLANSDLDITLIGKRAFDGRLKSVVILSATYVFGIMR